MIPTLALLPDDVSFHISFQWHSIQNRHTTAPVVARILDEIHEHNLNPGSSSSLSTIPIDHHQGSRLNRVIYI